MLRIFLFSPGVGGGVQSWAGVRDVSMGSGVDMRGLTYTSIGQYLISKDSRWSIFYIFFDPSKS